MQLLQINSSIAPAVSNLYVENSNISFEELIEKVKEGTCITGLSGFDVDLVNGDSRRIRISIENGK